MMQKKYDSPIYNTHAHEGTLAVKKPTDRKFFLNIERNETVGDCNGIYVGSDWPELLEHAVTQRKESINAQKRVNSHELINSMMHMCHTLSMFVMGECNSISCG